MPSNQIIAIFGPQGTGKSTLARLISGQNSTSSVAIIEAWDPMFQTIEDVREMAKTRLVILISNVTVSDLPSDFRVFHLRDRVLR